MKWICVLVTTIISIACIDMSVGETHAMDKPNPYHDGTSRVRRSADCHELYDVMSHLLMGSGWRKFAHSSHDYWYKLHTTRKNYHEAAGVCSSMGARLATEGMRITYIRNQVIDNLVRPGGYSTWIGLKEVNQSWFWIDGVLSTRSNTAWAPKEPNNPVEKCGDLHPYNGHYKVNDERCSSQLNFLCEKVVESP